LEFYAYGKSPLILSSYIFASTSSLSNSPAATLGVEVPNGIATRMTPPVVREGQPLRSTRPSGGGGAGGGAASELKRGRGERDENDSNRKQYRIKRLFGIFHPHGAMLACHIIF
jgi:hypothetical protein